MQMKELIHYYKELIAQNEDKTCLKWVETTPELHIVINSLYVSYKSMQINSFWQ